MYCDDELRDLYPSVEASTSRIQAMNNDDKGLVHEDIIRRTKKDFHDCSLRFEKYLPMRDSKIYLSIDLVWEVQSNYSHHLHI